MKYITTGIFWCCKGWFTLINVFYTVHNSRSHNKKIMTIKTILYVSFIAICLNVFAQEAKPYLFIGRYDKDKTYCSNQGWVHEEVKDAKEYEIRRLQHREEHKADVGMTYPTDYVTDKQCVIAYEVQRRNGAFNCNQTFIVYMKGKSVENCKELLAKQIADNGPGYYLTQPNIIYTWCGGNAGASGGSIGGNKIACEKLPQVLISETGVYYWKTDDGSYIILTKDQYEKAKKLPGDSEKKKFIQDCSGQNLPHFKAPGHYD